MSEATVEVPAVGRVKKQYVYVAAALVAGIVGFAYWRRSSAPVEDFPAYTDEDVISDGVTDTAGGAAGGSASSGGTGGGDSSTTPDSDSEWVMMAREALAGSFDDAALSIALGRYIGREGLSQAQQDMVRAAIGSIGYPPGGHYPITPDTAGSPSTFNEPTGLKATAKTTTSVTLSWNRVAGASGYSIFRSDLGSEPVGDSGDTVASVRGLEPNRTYVFTVAARTGAGATGPRSQPLTVKTEPVKLAKPSTPSVSGITRTSVKVSTGRVSGARDYHWYLNGRQTGGTDGPTYTITGLKPNTTYRVSVAADTPTPGTGPRSAERTFKTKR